KRASVRRKREASGREMTEAATQKATGNTLSAPRMLAALVLLCLGMGASGCAGVPPSFSGPGDFYEVPSPLPAGPPGALIRVQSIPSSPRAPGLTFFRVMYHSRDTQNRDVAVTGLVVVPDHAPPHGGWPVVAHAHGTTGLAASCAPSRHVNDYQGFGVDGVIAATDYLGLGPTGQLHAYMSGPSEGRAMIDIVRAARTLTHGRTNNQWIASGASQGGHAALFAGEQATHYAPELDLVGVVAIEPSSEAMRSFGAGDSLMTAVEVMSLYGRAVDHPQLNPDAYVAPAVAEWAKRLNTVCLADAVATFPKIAPEKVWTTDPRQTEPQRTILAESTPGRVAIRAPVLLVQGGADVVVTPQRTQAFRARACATGDRIDFRFYPDGAHDTTPGKAAADIGVWLQDRLAGRTSANTCEAAARP
ncbi:MAG: lipase family protein, partial [Alphaproteobacteria bacterium]